MESRSKSLIHDGAGGEEALDVKKEMIDIWQHMAGQGMGYGMGLTMVLWTAVLVWFVIFTILIVNKLNRIIRLLERK